MNLTIKPTIGSCNFEYRLEPTGPTHLFYTDNFILSGKFGRLKLSRIDLGDCAIWHTEPAITESLIIQGIIDKSYHQIEISLEQENPGKWESQFVNNSQIWSAQFSKTNNLKINLALKSRRLFILRYRKTYFRTTHKESRKLQNLFPTDPSGRINVINFNEATLHLVNRILQARPDIVNFREFMQSKLSLLHTAIVQYNTYSNSIILSEKDIDAIQKAKSIIISDLSKSHSGYELSNLVGANSSTLKTNFKSWIGIPLHQYLHCCRMEKAITLLQFSTLSVKEIAFNVGYKNVSNFSETFKNYYGFPPSKVWENP